ncbi:hypothetical protein THF1D04_10721 [Vibrio owensii]|uniref:Uncharacterized protein n=1 Tax=Vibrio owensii TaxID=696485 RepID=A0AAU9PYL0_9VIBR|nr:hypothetical protein THF1D04_10721 [Vibrio owensii]
MEKQSKVSIAVQSVLSSTLNCNLHKEPSGSPSFYAGSSKLTNGLKANSKNSEILIFADEIDPKNEFIDEYAEIERLVELKQNAQILFAKNPQGSLFSKPREEKHWSEGLFTAVGAMRR